MLVSLLLIFVNNVHLFSADKVIGGVINKYAAVTSIPGTDRVIVSDATEFSAGDTILIIQMQGVEILTADDGSYGNIQNTLGTPGGYEFLIIQSVNTGTGEIVFRNSFIRTYDVRGKVQIVRVPYYNSATVTSTLTSGTWNNVANPDAGGVVALIVGRTLKLNADIDVSGKGFRGGVESTGTGFCIATNPALYNLYSYPAVSFNAGYKGEGIALHDAAANLLDPDHVKGMGPNYSGGGGGNGRFSGGGGGSNRGVGGLGGYESGECLNAPMGQFPLPGGMGGLSIGGVLANGIFMGGGGGSSTYITSEGTASAGGRGGGIVIIVTDTIIGNGRAIRANGIAAAGATLHGGAGGGGGGGSIILSLQSYSDKNLTLNANGGNGGAHTLFGGGGGGGGGFIWVSTAIPTGTVTATISGGLAGTSATSGSAGEIRGSFKAMLNGFLFNSIRSSITGNLVDSICSNVVPKQLTGTTPIGGTGPYTYLWEKSYNEVTWVPLTNDANPLNYTPTSVESNTVYFRRTITDSSLPVALVDVSKTVRVIVQPYIKNNIVGTSDIICYGQDPATLTSLALLQDGNGRYTFSWEVSTDNVNYNIPSNPHTSQNYTPPPALTITSWYRRTVVSGRCIDTSVPVNMTVLDTISNNRILSAPQDICFGTTFTNLTATVSPALKGGDNVYRYRWESNINGSGWTVAPGTSNQSGYNPVELASRVPFNEYYFRRVVMSGSDDVCVNTSRTVLLKDFPVITNNTISPTQTICSGSAPALITGSVPQNGNGIYTYAWQDSSRLHSWTTITGATSRDFQPPALTDTTGYRRIVFSSQCSDISKSVRIKVHKPIQNNIISFRSLATDTTICSGATPGRIAGKAATGGTDIAGDYAYEWYYSTDNVSFIAVAAAGTGRDYQPAQLTTTTYYKRKTISGQCVDFSAVVRVTVLAPVTNNTITASQRICINSAPAHFTGSNPSGGSGTYTYLWEESIDGILWSPARGSNNLINYQSPAITVPTKFRRRVFSGPANCCTDIMDITSEWIEITLWQDINVIDAGQDRLLHSFEFIDTLNALDPPLGEGKWSTISSAGSPVFDDDTLYNTVVRNMGAGQNILEWTVTNGACVKSDQVIINILDIVIPEGFSPNGDSVNDEFEIKGLDTGNNTASLLIINSFGSQVYKNDDYKGRWEGLDDDGNKLPDGTYYYLLTIDSDRISITTQRSGFIILKR